MIEQFADLWMILTISEGSALLCALVTGVLVRKFRAAGIVDEVGARSSHSRPTPRGGGLAFVLASTAAWVLAAFLLDGVDQRFLVLTALSGVAVASIGLLDDVRGAPVPVRLVVHFGAASLGVWAVCAGGAWHTSGWQGTVVVIVLVIAVAWFVNAFNFMDGTDGFAASHGLAVSLLIVLLLWNVTPTPATLLALSSTIACAVLGFLPFNWPVARIFMGDVGSGWLGLVVALMLVATSRAHPDVALAGLALLAPLLMDPTVCLVRRALRGERVWQAHRSHGFQNLSRQLGSHARLLAVWWGVVGVLYLPCALLMARSGDWLWVTVAMAGGAVQALALKSGVPGIAERTRN